MGDISILYQYNKIFLYQKYRYFKVDSQYAYVRAFFTHCVSKNHANLEVCIFKTLISSVNYFERI